MLSKRKNYHLTEKVNARISMVCHDRWRCEMCSIIIEFIIIVHKVNAHLIFDIFLLVTKEYCNAQFVTWHVDQFYMFLAEHQHIVAHSKTLFVCSYCIWNSQLYVNCRGRLAIYQVLHTTPSTAMCACPKIMHS